MADLEVQESDDKWCHNPIEQRLQLVKEWTAIRMLVLIKAGMPPEDAFNEVIK